jgi:hypothetical protein
VRAAVVNSDTGIVVNVIVVNSLNDISPDGCFLADADNAVCAAGWRYDPVVNDFIDPSPPPIEGVVDGN